MNRRNSILASALVATLSGTAGGARADKISAMPDEDGKSIAYTPCEPGEDAAECLVYTISCRPNEVFGTGLELTVIGQGGGEKPDMLSIGRAMLAKPYGEQKLAFKIGGKTVEVPVGSVTISGNELNGDWDVTVRSMDESAFYEALNESSSGSVSAGIGGFNAQLADNKAEAKALIKFKTECTR